MLPIQKRPWASHEPSFRRTFGVCSTSHRSVGEFASSSSHTPVSPATTRPPPARGRTIAATGPGTSITRVVPLRERGHEDAAGEHVDPGDLAGAREPARALAVVGQGLGDLLDLHGA